MNNQYINDNLDLLKHNPNIWNTVIDSSLKTNSYFINQALEQNGLLLEFIDTSIITKEMCLKALDNNDWARMFIPQALYIELEQEFWQHPIIDQKYQSMIKRACVDSDKKISEILGFIEPENFIPRMKIPSPELAEKALQKNGLLLEHILNQNEEQIWTAIKQNHYAIRFARYPNEKQMMFCVKKDNSLIKYIASPTIAVQRYCIKKDSNNFLEIGNPCDEIIDFSLKLDPLVLSHIKQDKQTYERCIRAIKKDPFALEHVIHQDIELIFEALSRDKAVRAFVNIEHILNLTSHLSDDDFYNFIKHYHLKNKVILKHL